MDHENNNIQYIEKDLFNVSAVKWPFQMNKIGHKFFVLVTHLPEVHFPWLVSWEFLPVQAEATDQHHDMLSNQNTDE